MEAVAGQSGGSGGHAESLSQRVPRLPAEDGVHQLDDLVLEGEESVIRTNCSAAIKNFAASI